MGANILRNKSQHHEGELPLESLPPNGRCGERSMYLRNYLRNMLSPLETPAKLDDKTLSEVRALIEQLGSDKWRDREAAHKGLERLLESDSGYCVLAALLEEHANCDAEQKYRIERLRREASGRSRMLSCYREPLANLALLLGSGQNRRRAAAERLKDKLEIKGGLIEATLEERTKFVLKALDRLCPLTGE
jgi:hypothetical protein